MNIFTFHCSKGKAGATMNLGFIVRALAERGHAVTVLYRSPDAGSSYLEEQGARIIYLNIPLGMNTTAILERSQVSLWNSILQHSKDPLKFLAGIPIALFYLLKERPDACFLMDITFPQVALVARVLGVRTVCQVQAELVEGQWGFRRRLLLRAFNGCAAVFGITEDHLVPFRPKRKGGPRTFCYIPNGVLVGQAEALGNQAKKFRQSLGISEQTKTIAFLGGDTPIKGFAELKSLAVRLAQQRADIVVLIAGVRSRHIDELPACMRFVGEDIDPLVLLKAADLLLVLHRFPHFSRPLLEAFAVGTPVVAGDDRFTRDLVEHGENGFLCDPGDLDTMCKLVKEVLDHPALSERLRQGGLKVFRDRYDPARIAHQIVKTFTAVEDSPGVSGGTA